MPAPLHDLRLTALVASLRSCGLFSGLPLGDLEEIAGFVRLRSLQKGEYLFREGEPVDGFFVVQRGAVNVHRVSPSGREQVIHVFREGSSFGEATLVTGTAYPADARAVEATSVILVPKGPFVSLLSHKPELALRILAAMSVHLHTLVGLVEDMTLKDVETRLVNWLLKRSRPDGQGAAEIRLDSTKRLLAAELSTSSETLSRTFARLRDEGLLVVDGNTLRIPELPLLEARFRLLLGESEDASGSE